MQKDGKTYGEHLAAVAARSADYKRRLDGPEMPDAVGYLWEYFLALHERRRHLVLPSGTLISEPIPYTEVAAWATLTGRALASYEVEILMTLDRTWLSGPLKEGELD